MPITLNTLDDELEELEASELERENDDAPPARHADEPRANEHGVLDTDVETVTVQLPKSWKVGASIDLAQDSHGWWYFGYHYGHPASKRGDLGGGAMPKIGGDKFRSRKAAQLAGLKHIIGHFTQIEDLRTADKIAVLHNQVEADVAEEVTAHDPETQEAIEDLKTVGITTGEPTPSESEQQAKAEAEFRQRMRDGADYLASCTLERISAEAAYKTAKAEEKAAAETLRKLADRGPERLPLFEAAERAKAEEPVSSEAATAVDPDAWKSASIDELGLPKGVTAKLVDEGIDTIGRLEQRRADIANRREKWPKGIGKAAIDKIEDAVLTWLETNEPLEQPAAVDDIAEEPEPAEVADTMAVGERLDWLLANKVEPNPDSDDYLSGSDAYDDGRELRDCPRKPGPGRDQWLLGWHAAAEDDDEL